MRATDLSAGQLTILAVVVDQDGDASVSAIYRSLPPPVDFLGLIDDLEELLERRLVERKDGEGAYRYVATRRGLVILRAWLHPAGASMEARA